MQFKFMRDGAEEMVPIERWAWYVKYADGGELAQFEGEQDKDGIFHQFKEVDHARVTVFGMYKPEDLSRKVEIVKPEGAQIFHFYRNIVLEAVENERRIRAYVFGWKKEGAETYIFIMPDDNVIVGNGNLQLEVK